MKNAPWLKFTTLSTPKISVSPTATRNSSMPMMKPLVVCVTRQAALARQPVSASRSKESVRYGGPGCVSDNRSAGRGGCQGASAPLTPSGVALALLPLSFERQNLLPVTALHLRDIRLGGNGGAPTDGIADQGLIFGSHCHSAVGAERRFDRQTT